MPAPAFGFSIGDFIAGIELAIKVFQACKDRGEAASELKAIPEELGAYLYVLDKLKSSPEGDAPEIHRLISICRAPIQEFRAQIEGKWHCSGRPSTALSPIAKFRVRVNVAYRRTRWAISGIKAVDRLRQRIGPHFLAIDILLNTTARSIPRNPSLLLSENIIFTDALGRQSSLSYTEFRKWPVFEARLRVTFQGLPGEQNVVQQQYTLLDTSKSQFLNLQYWEECVTPRSKITMSVIVHHTGTKNGTCPQPTCKSEIGQRILCPYCGTASLPAYPVVDIHRDKPLMPKKINEEGNSSTAFAEKYFHVPRNESNRDAPFSSYDRADGMREKIWVSKVRDTHENLEKAELKFFKYIHVKPDLGALGFKEWSPRFMAHLDLKSRPIQRMKTPLSPHQKREGWIYVFQRQEVFGLCKVGYTSCSVEARRWQLSIQCYGQLGQIWYQRRVKIVLRVKDLVHTELVGHRQVECVCNGCKRMHREWFALSPDKVVAIIERWAQWMDSEPYNAEGTLDDPWLE